MFFYECTAQGYIWIEFGHSLVLSLEF